MKLKTPLLRSSILFVFVLFTYGQRSSYSKWAERKLKMSFKSTCLGYEWVRNYLRDRKEQETNKDKERYAIFIYDDGYKRAKKGGMGDRLGGIITTFAWAMRSNRTFLIEADKSGLAKMLGPYPSGSGSWSDWSWSGYKEKDIPKEQKQYLWCYNPKPSNRHCGLDNANEFDDYRVVRVRTNRCYLCRWADNPHLAAHEEMMRTFGIEMGANKTNNLFDIAGCILRLALWPTEELWTQLDAVFEGVKNPPYQVGMHFRCGDHNYKNAPLHPEMSNHMECVQKEGLPWNGTHAVDEHSWQSPVDLGTCAADLSMSAASIMQRHNYQRGSSRSKQELKKGQVQAIDHRGSSFHKDIIAYIASDNPASAEQIKTLLSSQIAALTSAGKESPEATKASLSPLSFLSLSFPLATATTSSFTSSASPSFPSHLQHNPSTTQSQFHVIMAPPGCHVDYDHGSECSAITTLVWFALVLNDDSVYQAFTYEPDNSETSQSTADLRSYSLTPSSFSRYAMIYSLSHPRSVHHPVVASKNRISATSVCLPSRSTSRLRVNGTYDLAFARGGSIGNGYDELARRISHFPQGNWVCTGGDIY